MTTNAGQTLALLYQQLADTDTAAGPARIDLHIHSTHSDGEYTPARILDEVELAGIPAFAVTDSTTLTVDFDVNDSFVKAGNSGKYIFKPVLKPALLVVNGDTLVNRMPR